MTLQQWVDSVLRLVGHLVSWPVVTLVIVVSFRRRVVSVLSGLTERARSASVGPLSVEFDEVAVEALQDTVRQAVQEPGADPGRLADFLGEQISKMTGHSAKRDEESFPGSRILWADDNIKHHLFEINYLQRLGVDIETAGTTAQALQALDAGKFDLVISDLHRIEDGIEEPRAGLKLLSGMRSSRIPLVLYTSNAVLLHGNEEVSRYGAAVTDTASDLFAEIKRILRREA
ncbi:response regulator [Nonomuraea sp. CA-141351]|uniref:response regulator n=1 Tax=Nonomuraea sp. CA-141351 TaxID=3239996 RepID=UPI003D918F99